MTTTNLADFGFREIGMAADLLKNYANGGGFCPYFSGDGVQLMMNQNSGNVFLTDENFNVLMMNGDRLEGFYVSPYSGHEGFFDDLCSNLNDSWHDEDKEWLKQLAKDLDKVEYLPKELQDEEEEEE